jgi:hypothetical protein
MAYAAPTPADVDGLSAQDVTKAVAALKESFIQPDALSDTELERATLQGLLDHLAPEATLESGTAGAGAAAPFHAEDYEGKTGYLRPGALTNVNMARQTLEDWSAKGIGAVVLDLRATTPSSDYDAAANLAALFCAKGTEMFSLTAGKGRTIPGADSADGQTRTFTAEADPVFKGVLVVLVDGETAEAAETVASALQKCAKAIVVGDKTAGRMFDYTDVPLGNATLRLAVARVILPDGREPGESGLEPDISVGLGTASKADVMASITSKGIDSVTEEYDRPHLNEAALVAGSNPDLDELEAEQSGVNPLEVLIDQQLERALDLVTSISIFQQRDK